MGLKNLTAALASAGAIVTLLIEVASCDETRRFVARGNPDNVRTLPDPTWDKVVGLTAYVRGDGRRVAVSASGQVLAQGLSWYDAQDAVLAAEVQS